MKEMLQRWARSGLSEPEVHVLDYTRPLILTREQARADLGAVGYRG
jgi:hypothetical protein